jgi:DNA-binding transcriptional regulator LsrR (DeoR family)
MISEQIKQALQEEYKSGKKQQEMAARHQVSQQYICRLLSGRRAVSGITVGVLEKMFPGATINLHGGAVVAENNGPNHGVVGTNNRTVNNGGGGRVARITQAVMQSDLTPEAKVAVWNIINETK